MVALAARVLASGLEALGLEPERQRDIALELFRAAGAGGMIGGQALDLEAEGRGLALAALEGVHRRQTGALVAAACVIGGLAGGAPPPALRGARRFRRGRGGARPGRGRRALAAAADRGGVANGGPHRGGPRGGGVDGGVVPLLRIARGQDRVGRGAPGLPLEDPYGPQRAATDAAPGGGAVRVSAAQRKRARPVRRPPCRNR